VNLLAPASAALVGPTEASASALVAQQAPSPDEAPATARAPAAPAPVASRAVASADRPRNRRHTVRDGESAWTIARRYGMPVTALLNLNGLNGKSIIRPGAVLRVED